ncbi:MAG: hypothetical protein AAGJ53_04160 [Pseudomonadota bacterium]
MTKHFEMAIEEARKLSADEQNQLADIIFRYAGKDETIYELSEQEMASLEPSLRAADRGEFASDEDVNRVLRTSRK